MKKNINQFPSKSKFEMNRILKSFIAASLVGTSSFAHLGQAAHAEELDENKLEDSSFIEKNAGPLDPSLRHATVRDLHNMPNYVTSTFYDKFNQLSNEKKDKINDNDEPIFDDKNKSFIKVNAQDYLHMISSNGDNVFVHYITSDGKRLSYTQKDLEKMQKEKDDNHSHSSFMPWLIYPFLLNGHSYSAHSNGMHSNMSSTTGKNAYSSRPNSSSFKNSVKSTSNSISKSSSSSSTRGMGGSMSKGGSGGISSSGG